MRKLKNKIKGNFRKNVTKAAIIAAAGFGAVSVTVPTFAAEMQHHCSCGENHDDPNCTCGCQEAKALVALTQGEYETSQATLSEKLEAQKKLQEQLDAAKKVHEEYVEALKAAIAENEAKAQAALDEAQAVLDSANAASEEAQAAFTAAQTEYDEALGALREAEEAYSALEEANPDIENEYNEAINALEEAQKELDQAVQEEEEAQSEKDEADKQAEDARKKREDARSARERAKEAADAAEKRRAEAQEAKQAADEALSAAQEKYNSADEAYSYKKGLADGTIPIETTPEWEEAKKTQEALDAATADKEKADAELKTAEDDLSEKEKALEAANADYDEKSKVCEETREQLRKAREELEAAQQENKEDKEALDAAKSEKDAADKDVENKTNELAAADKALEDAKKAQEDAQKALADAEKAKKEAEEKLQMFKDEKRNSRAFCNWITNSLVNGYRYSLIGNFDYDFGAGDGDRYIQAIIEDATTAIQRFDYLNNNENSKVKGSSDLTDEKDATNINNTYETIKFLRECNALRQREGLDELRVSLALMMIAQAQLNWSDYGEDHSKATGVGENLAWGQKNTADVDEDLKAFYIDENEKRGRGTGGPFASWYSLEKHFKEHPELKEEISNYQTGHYENIIRPYTITGFAYDTYSNYGYGTAFGQTFSDEKVISEEYIPEQILKEDLRYDLNEYIRNMYGYDKNLDNITDEEKQELLDRLTYEPILGRWGRSYTLSPYGQRISLDDFNRMIDDRGVRDVNVYYEVWSANFLTVDDFETLLTGYMDEIKKEQENLEEALTAAESALSNAKTAKTTADNNVTTKTNEKTAAENALSQAEQTQTDKTKALEEATAKEATSAKRIQDAETALGLRTEENDTAEKDLTTAEEVQTAAKTERDTAAGVKDEKQKEADAKNETFTEAKSKDDAADQVVQDILDGKEVPALEEAANAAKEELDKATGDQAAADTELKAVEDDSKAKADDLSAKTEEEEAAVKDQEDKEAAAKAKAEALTSAIENKNAKEGIKNAAEEKAADTKKRLDDKNNAETAKNNAQTKSDDAKAKADDAKSKADAAASDAAKANTDANSAKQALDAAKALNADDALKSDDDSYNQFKEAIDAVKGAIVSEDDANAKYTEAEAESVVAEADEKTKKEAYDNAVKAYSTVHEHCGHDEMQAVYNCTQGNGNVWTKGSGVTSDFTFTRAHMDETAFDHFTGVSVDGKTLDKSAYTASAGSVIVKLSDKFLETLAVGDHTIKAEFDDGSAEAKFTVRAASGSGTVTETKKTTPVKTVGAAQQVITTPSANVQTAQKAPATGDAGAAVWIISAAASAAVIAGAVLYRRKRADRG